MNGTKWEWSSPNGGGFPFANESVSVYVGTEVGNQNKVKVTTSQGGTQTFQLEEVQSTKPREWINTGMKGYLTIDTEEEYNAWLASEAEYLDFGDDEDDWGDDDDW